MFGYDRRVLERLTAVEQKLDAVMRHLGVAGARPAAEPDQVADLVRQGRKIQAVKAYRDATGASLREAKDAVDELERRLPGAGA